MDAGTQLTGRRAAGRRGLQGVPIFHRPAAMIADSHMHVETGDRSLFEEFRFDTAERHGFLAPAVRHSAGTSPAAARHTFHRFAAARPVGHVVRDDYPDLRPGFLGSTTG